MCSLATMLRLTGTACLLLLVDLCCLCVRTRSYKIDHTRSGWPRAVPAYRLRPGKLWSYTRSQGRRLQDRLVETGSHCGEVCRAATMDRGTANRRNTQRM